MSENEILNEDESLEEVETDEVDETEVLKEEILKKQDSFLRLTAEYDNFRKRTAKERQNIHRDAISFACEALLPTYDTLSSALIQTTDENQRKGLELTFKQLLEGFAKLGVSPIEDSKGTAFDTNLHNAVMHIEDDSFEQNVIVETFQKGFKINDKVIRYSTVKVAN